MRSACQLFMQLGKILLLLFIQIFHPFWFAPIPRLIIHNQLVSNKFGRCEQVYNNLIVYCSSCLISRQLSCLCLSELKKMVVTAIWRWNGRIYDFMKLNGRNAIIHKKILLDGWHLLFKKYLQEKASRFISWNYAWRQASTKGNEEVLGCGEQIAWRILK